MQRMYCSKLNNLYYFLLHQDNNFERELIKLYVSNFY